MASIEFDKWLNELRDLPSSAPQWEIANQFVEDVRQIIAEKESERNQITELCEAIDAVKRHSDDLAYAGVTDKFDSWMPGDVPSNLPTFMDVISEFHEIIHNLQAIRDNHDTASELFQAVELVQGKFKTLQDLLTENRAPRPASAVPVEENSNVTPLSVQNDQVEGGTNENIGEPKEHISDLQMIGEQDTTREISTDDHEPLVEDDKHSVSPGTDAHLPKVDKPSENEQLSAASPQVPDEAICLVDSEPDAGNDDIEDVHAGTSEPQGFDKDGKVEELENDTSGEPSQDVGNDSEEPCKATTTIPPAVEPPEMERQYGIVESKAAAKRFLESSSLNDLETFMWSLVAADDLSAAYWVARHLDEQGHENVIPPELLKAVQGSRWLVPDSNRYVEDLFQFQSVYDATDASSPQELLELAASLRSSMIAPHSNMWGLLKTPTACPAAGPVILATSEFARNGYALRPEYIEGMGEAVRNQDEIVAASAAAKSWLEGAPTRRYHTFQTATNVWIHLVGSGGEISEMLAPVKEDDRSQVQMVRGKSDELAQDLELINRIGRSLAEGPWSPITGRARNWLLNGITEANNLAERWCELVEYERDVREKEQDPYLSGLVTNLRSEVQRQSSQFVQSLQELTSESNPADIASAARCALRSTIQMLKVLDIHNDVDVPEVPIVVQDLTAINRSSGSHDLAAAVGRRRLWTDTVEIGDDGNWTGGALERDILGLAKGVSKSMLLEEAVEQRFSVHDFRFTEMMTKAIPLEQRENLNSRRQTAQRDSLETLKGHVERVDKEVLQAVRDGVIEISDDNWSRYDEVLKNINGVVQSEYEILNYTPMFSQLHDIQKGIDCLKSERRDQFQQEWDEISQLVDSAMPAVQAWQDKFNRSRDAGNIRVMEECVIRLRNHSQGESLPDADSTLDDTADNTLSDYVAYVDGILNIEEHVLRSGGLTALESRLTF